MLDKLTRKAVRREARGNLKRRYFLNVLVVFIVYVVMNGGYQFVSSQNYIDDKTNSLSSAASIAETAAEDAEAYSSTGTKLSNADILMSFLGNVFEFKVVADPDGISNTSAKYTAGVASVFVNQISGSQSFIFGIINGINNVVFSGRIASSVIIFIFAALSIAYFILVRNVIIIGRNRYFLEQRRYAGTTAKEIFFPYKNKRIKNLSRVMLRRYLQQLAWDFTIVGGVIKHYEYILIPYIIAENPNISSKDAFAISKELMKGEKWNTFLLELSLLPWTVLSMLTYRISAIFYSDVYFEAVYAEMYMRIRDAKHAELSEWRRQLLCDYMLSIDHVEKGEHPSGVEVPDIKLPKVDNLERDYMRRYGLLSLVQLFFSFSFAGWLWEVCFYLATTGNLVNRGTMHGPWLPIYGCGGVLIMTLLRPFRKKPWLMFATTTVLCGIVEYATSYLLEVIFDKKWWDYSGYFLNLNGRICFEGLLVFGLAGIAFTYLISPWLDDFYSRFNINKRKVICTVLSILFIADMIWSALSPNAGAGITDGLV